MTEKQNSTSKTIVKIEARHGTEAAIARSDVIASHRLVNDVIKDQWVEYQDPEGNVSSSPNSFMTLRKHWNRMFGIKSVKDLDGDPERSLLYALADMLRQGAAAIDHFIGDTSPALSVIRGDAT